MRNPAGWIAAALVALLPLRAGALELLVPTPGSTLKETKVRVIGLAPDQQKVKIEFAGQATSLRVKDGKFFGTLSLGEGTHKLKITAGDKIVEVALTVDPKAAKGFFVYHDSVEENKCQACHEESGQNGLSRDSDVSSVCQRCHSRYDTKKHVHGPVAMGLCSACHNPHGSVNVSLLRMGIQDLCQDCHNEPITKAHSERSGGKSCVECHEPHGSDKPFQIKK
jgi:predicted CXXCH cytochrome family protein